MSRTTTDPPDGAIALADLRFAWLGTAAGRGGLGIAFDCPHCVRELVDSRAAADHPDPTARGVAWRPEPGEDPPVRLAVLFREPLDREPMPPAEEILGLDGATLLDPTPRDHGHAVVPTHVSIEGTLDFSGAGHWRGVVRDGACIDADDDPAARNVAGGTL